LEVKMDELREWIKIELIAKCPFVDKCERQCTPTDQEDCYGEHADAIVSRIKEFGYLSPEEARELLDCYANESMRRYNKINEQSPLFLKLKMGAGEEPNRYRDVRIK